MSRSVLKGTGKLKTRDSKSRLNKRPPIKYSRTGLSKAFSSRETSTLRSGSETKKSEKSETKRKKQPQTRKSWLESPIKSGRRESLSKSAMRQSLKDNSSGNR